MRGRVLGVARSARSWARAVVLCCHAMDWTAVNALCFTKVQTRRLLRHPFALARSAKVIGRVSRDAVAVINEGGEVAPVLDDAMARLAREIDPADLALLGGLPAATGNAELARVMEEYRWKLWQHLEWAMAVQRDAETIRLQHPLRLLELGRDVSPPRVGDFVMVHLRFLFPRTAEGESWPGEMLVLRVEQADLFGTGTGGASTVFVGSVLPPTHRAAHLSGILPGDEILFTAAHVDECTQDLGAWGMSAPGEAAAPARGDRQRPGQAVSQKDAVAGTIETPADPRCHEIAGRMPGWGCCQCRTYNNHPRERKACKLCGHARCDAAAPGAN